MFLCGPYIAKNKLEDRRIILQNDLLDICGDNVFPLIIDEFLTKENVNSDINIEILEEIFAAISDKTHVFLDTLATAAESGLFMNHMMKSKNRLSIYVPIKEEVYEKGRLGYFIRDVFIGMNPSQIKLIEYHPSIKRFALYTDYVVEHFYFIDNKLPKEIYESISDDKPSVIDTELKLKNSIDVSKNQWEISYFYDQVNHKWNVFSSIKLIFYSVTTVLYTDYSDELNKCNPAQLIDFNIDDIANKVTEAFKNYVYTNTGIDRRSIVLKTPLNISTHDVIYHITAFVYVYHHFATISGRQFLTKPEYLIEEMGIHPFKVFHINYNDLKLLDDLFGNYNDYYEELTIKKRGKVRELVTYKNSEKGKRLRELHKKINDAICKGYHSNGASFAYQNGKSITMCASAHIQGIGFAKYDIKQFFNSIKYKHLLEAIEKEFKIDKRYHNATGKIVRSFFVNNVLPLGLITSPILSDIYLNDIDRQMAGFAAGKNYVYTRYADDIMFSTASDDFKESIVAVENRLIKALSDVDLKLNMTKRRIEVLDTQGKHIRYIGINIVRGSDKNYLTVGKKYIYDTAKEYLQYLKLKTYMRNNVEDEEKTNYIVKRLKGRVAFIKQVDGKRGLIKLKRRLGNRPEFFKGKVLNLEYLRS